MTMIAEGAEASRVEEAVEKRKRKVEDDKRWEGELFSPRSTASTRRGRVANSVRSRRYEGRPSNGLALVSERAQEEEEQVECARVRVS